MGVLGDVQQHSGREHRDEQRRATKRDEGQRQPFRRQEAHHDTQVHERLDRDQHRDPKGKVRAEGVGGTKPDAEPPPDEHHEKRDDRHRAQKSELFSDDRKDEVRMRFRQVDQFLLRGADPRAEHAAVADREPGLDDLKPAATRVRPWIEERGDAPEPVRRRRDGERGEGHGGGENQPEVPETPSRQEQQRERQRDQGQAVAEVGLGEHERAKHPRDHERRQEPLTEVVERLVVLSEERREVDDERELREFRRLEGYRPEPNPPARPVDRLTDRWEEHEDEQRGRHDEERHHEPLEPPVVHAEREPEARGAEHRPEDLLLQEEVGVAEPAGRDDRPRRVHHPHARREEHDGGAEEPGVRRELPRHLSSSEGASTAPSEASPRIRLRRQSRRSDRGSCDAHRGTHSSRSTSFLNTSPRCSKLSNMSNEAHAGESSTTSPGMASWPAASTAASSDGHRATGIDAPLNAAASFGASSPIRNAWPTRPRAAVASGSKSCPLPLPPAINKIRSEKLSSALSVDATLVPFESL